MTDKQTKYMEKEREERKLQKALSFTIAKEYCIKNGLSIEKLKNQEFYTMYGSSVFAQPSGIIPNGLCNDRETMPLITLVISSDDNDNVTLQQTEYTKKYLSL